MAAQSIKLSSSQSILEQSYIFGKSPLSSISKTQNLRTYLFGYPIAHSLAPFLHNEIFRTLSIPWSYSLHESMNQEGFLDLLHAEDCIGTAVTMPHKVTFLSAVDSVTEEGRLIGAINTVFIRLDNNGQKRYIGTNTDCIGIREAFAQNIPGSLEAGQGRPAMVLGGGGACRSAIYALWKWGGASKIYLVCRLASEVEAIIKSFETFPEFTCPLVHLDTIESAYAAERPVLVVGTFPDFPPKEPGEILARSITHIVLDKLKADGGRGFVVEMCYHPKIVTGLYTICEEAGWEVVPGTEPMIHQGIAQEVLWTETPLEQFSDAIAAGTRLVNEKLKNSSH